MKDSQMCIARYRNNILVSFCATMSNAMPERRMVFHCTEGTMSIELYSKELKYRQLFKEETVTIKFNGDGHGGGDSFIMKELYGSMCSGSEPKCSGSEGLESAVFALALDEAAEKGTIIDLEKVWQKLQR